MEAYAGRGALERRARGRHAKGAETDLLKIMKKRDRARMTSGIWARALKREDGLACKLIAKAVEALGAGVASAVNVVDVEAVILGGGLGVRLGQPYADKVATAMLPHLFNDHRPPACPGRRARRPFRSDRRRHALTLRPSERRVAFQRRTERFFDAAPSTVEKQ